MIALDQDALECDLAETYHVLNMRELPARRVALFASGLRAESRIAQKISNTEAPVNTLLLATIADALKILIWQNTGGKSKNKPSSIVESLLKKERVGFDTVEEFDEWRAKMIGGENG